MTKEDAVKWLENLKQDIGQFRHEDLWHYEQAIYEIIALLEGQDAVKRTSRKGTDGFSIIWTCGACGSNLHPNNAKAKYCSNCGQAVKWE